MPGGDRTGPWGDGPMTGRAAGSCAGHSVPGYANPAVRCGRGWGRGYGRGRGRGFGRGRYAYPPVAVVTPVNPQTQPQLPEQEVAALENYQKNLTAEKADLEQELEGVKARIEEVKAKIKSN